MKTKHKSIQKMTPHPIISFHFSIPIASLFTNGALTFRESKLSNQWTDKLAQKPLRNVYLPLNLEPNRLSRQQADWLATSTFECWAHETIALFSPERQRTRYIAHWVLSTIVRLIVIVIGYVLIFTLLPQLAPIFASKYNLSHSHFIQYCNCFR